MKKRKRTGEEAREEALRLLNLGANLLAQGRATDALGCLEQAYRLDAGSVPVCINLGGAYVMCGRHKRAIPVLEAARDAEPGNAMIWINLGAAYLGNPVLATADQQNQAIGAFEKALQIDPAAPNVHYNLGLILLDRGDRDLAVAAFRRAVEVNPLDRDARQWLGKLEALQQEDDEPA
jgi:tetratricopeptide (TPR) repeat protein